MYLVIGESGQIFSKSHDLWRARSSACQSSIVEKVCIQKDGSRLSAYYKSKPIPLKEMNIKIIPKNFQD